MKATQTTYPQIQAIEPTPKSKKSGVLIGVGLGLFVAGMALYGFGIVYKFSLAFGVVSAIVGFLTIAAGNKLAPSCDFPKKEYDSSNTYTGSIHSPLMSNPHASLRYQRRGSFD